METLTMPMLLHIPSVRPSLQTPKPTQPHNDPRYYHLLESRVYPQPLRHSSPSSSNPSPSSTLCSSGSSATLVLEEEMIQEKEGLWPYASVASSSKGYTQWHDGVLRKKVEYRNWMLNPGSAHYAPLFSPIDSHPDVQVDEESGSIVEESCRNEYGNVGSSIASSSPWSPAISRPLKRQRTSTYRHIYPSAPWSEFFRMGCRSRNRDAVSYYARKIVHSQRWDEDDDNLLDLVHAFVRHAVDVNVEPQEREHMSVFASRVLATFRNSFLSTIPCPTKRLDLKFRDLMRETVMGTFISCWHLAPENPDAITYTIAHTPSPSYLFYVTSALHLCSFIGDLYVEKFLSRADTVSCIRIIFYNLSLVDHLAGVKNILTRAGTKLWKEANFPIPGYGVVNNLDREVYEFEEQMQRALHVVQDHRYVFAASIRPTDDERSVPRIGIAKRKVWWLIRYVRACRQFVNYGCVTDRMMLVANR